MIDKDLHDAALAAVRRYHDDCGLSRSGLWDGLEEIIACARALQSELGVMRHWQSSDDRD